MRRAYALAAIVAGMLLLVSPLGFDTLQARVEAHRQPPTISRGQTVRLFEQQRYDEAFAAAVHRYEWGDQGLHYPLGTMLRNGLGTRRDAALAREHFAAGARAGDPRSQFALAEMLRLGEGGSVDRDAACSWYLAARRLHADAAYQAAICALNQGRTGDAMQALHQIAGAQHAAATGTLLAHYRRLGNHSVVPSAAYQLALKAWFDQRYNEAIELAQQAIAAGDYRAYAVIGESRQTGQDSADELSSKMIELGLLFGSGLPSFATGQRLAAKGYGEAACDFYLRAFQRDLKRAAGKLAECLSAGQLAQKNHGLELCTLHEIAFSAGDAGSSRAWINCLREREAEAQVLARNYVKARELDPGFEDIALREQICQGRETRRIAADIQLDWQGLPAGESPSLRSACVLQQDGDKILLFSAFEGWLSSAKVSDLVLPVSRYGIPLAGLRQGQLRELLEDHPRLMPLKLRPDVDELRLKATDSVNLRIEYDAEGQLKRYIETRRHAPEDSFRIREEDLNTLLGPPTRSSETARFMQRDWQTRDWSVQLMMLREENGLREVYQRQRISPAG